MSSYLEELVPMLLEVDPMVRDLLHILVGLHILLLVFFIWIFGRRLEKLQRDAIIGEDSRKV